MDVKGKFKFAIDLYKEAVKNKNGNIFISPYSISAAFSMLLLGAKEKTAEEIKQVLIGEELSSDDIHNYHKSILQHISQIDSDIVLKSANKLFIEKSYDLTNEFLKGCEEFYEAGVEQVNFIQDSNKARLFINDWVEKKTEYKIQNLLPSGSVDSETRLVIANAVYFKGDWLKSFDVKRTTSREFFISENKTKNVQMMTQESRMPYCFNKDLNIQVVELPYKGETVSMILLVPNDQFGLNSLEAELSFEKLQQLSRQCYSEKVILSLPKFKLESSYDLKLLLTSLGIRDAFNVANADLEGISGKSDLFVSDAFHKTFLDVNEEGTEAAAATAVVLMARSARLQSAPVHVNCNHPFMFVIKHNATQTILFIGRLSTFS